MTDLTQNPSNDSQGWRTLAEFLITDRTGGEGKVEHIMEVLETVGLNPPQVRHILGTLDQTLQNVETTHTPLNLRISLKGDHSGERSEKIIKNSLTIQTAEIGLGFFIIQRFIQQAEETCETTGHFALEVLIYSER